GDPVLPLCAGGVAGRLDPEVPAHAAARVELAHGRRFGDRFVGVRRQAHQQVVFTHAEADLAVEQDAVAAEHEAFVHFAVRFGRGAQGGDQGWGVFDGHRAAGVRGRQPDHIARGASGALSKRSGPPRGGGPTLRNAGRRSRAGEIVTRGQRRESRVIRGDTRAASGEAAPSRKDGPAFPVGQNRWRIPTAKAVFFTSSWKAKLSPYAP